MYTMIHTMYDWLLVSNFFFVCSHPSWNEESKEFDAFDAGRIIISMSVATKLFNERCRWENVCIPSWRNEDYSLGQKSFVKWFFDNRKSDWTMWKPTSSNHCMFFFSKTTAKRHEHHETNTAAIFSPCRSTTAVGSGRALLRPPFFFLPSPRRGSLA